MCASLQKEIMMSRGLSATELVERNYWATADSSRYQKVSVRLSLSTRICIATTSWKGDQKVTKIGAYKNKDSARYLKINNLQSLFVPRMGALTIGQKPIECQIVANLDSFFSVTLLKHFCQSVSFYYWKDNINIVQYKYCFYLCEKDDVWHSIRYLKINGCGLWRMTMSSAIEFLEAHQSPTPSRWREDAQWRRDNEYWLKYARYITLHLGYRFSQIGPYLRQRLRFICTLPSPIPERFGWGETWSQYKDKRFRWWLQA